MQQMYMKDYLEISTMVSVMVQEVGDSDEDGDDGVDGDNDVSVEDRTEFLSLAMCKFFIKMRLLLSTTFPSMCSILRQAPIMVSRYLEVE